MALNLQKLQAQLVEMETYIPQKDEINSQISSAPTGWHLSHNLKVINNIITFLASSDPEDYKKEFSFKRLLVFTTRRIPRGKARSPKVVLPPEVIKTEDLKESVIEAKENIMLLNSFNAKAYFDHPYFKHLNRNQTKTFLEIHTEHHLKIIRDILN